MQPNGIQAPGVRNQVAVGSGLFADLLQPVRVRAVVRANHENHVAPICQQPHRALAVLRRVADVVHVRPPDSRETRLQLRDDLARIVDAECRLGHVGNLLRIGRGQRRHIGHIRHQMDHAGHTPHRPLDLGVSLVSDEDDLVTLPAVTSRFVVYLAHQRTGRIDHPQPADAGLVLHFPGHAMGAEHRDGVLRDVFDVFDEASALVAQTVDNVLVVDNFVANVDGRTIDLERSFDDVDGPDDSGTESSRLCEQDMQRLLCQLLSPDIDAMCKACRSPLYSGDTVAVDRLPINSPRKAYALLLKCSRTGSLFSA